MLFYKAQKGKRILRHLIALAVIGYGSVFAHDETTRVLEGFEQRSLSKRWGIAGKLNVSRVSNQDTDFPLELRRNRYAARIQTEGKSGFYTTTLRLPRKWQDVNEISFWAFRSPRNRTTDSVPTLEVRFLESDGLAQFWKRFKIEHIGWKQYRTTLRWMRWGKKRIPKWSQINRIAFWFRDPTDILIDEINVESTPRKQQSKLKLTELINTAFPEQSRDEIRLEPSPDKQSHHSRLPHLIVTDSPFLNVEQLSEHLEKTHQFFHRQLPFVPRAASPVMLIVFSNEEDYRTFPHRLAAKLNSDGTTPKAAGFTIHGIATSFWSEKFGTLRPVYTHEYVHALITKTLFLPSQGSWLHEGLASHVQIHFHPQPNLGDIVSEGIANPRLHLPLQALCNGKRISVNRYWQALTVVETLLSVDRYRQNLPRLLHAFQQFGSADLTSQLELAFPVSWKEFTDTWYRFCRKHYPRNNTLLPSIPGTPLGHLSPQPPGSVPSQQFSPVLLVHDSAVSAVGSLSNR